MITQVASSPIGASTTLDHRRTRPIERVLGAARGTSRRALTFPHAWPGAPSSQNTHFEAGGCPSHPICGKLLFIFFSVAPWFFTTTL